MVRFLGGPLRLNERAADDIFSGWTSPSRYKPPADVEKHYKLFLSSKNHSVAIKASETSCHCYADAVGYFKANLLFPSTGPALAGAGPNARPGHGAQCKT